MNFLAHCALGRAHPDHLVGSYLGDFVKGPVPASLPAAIQVGVRLHRRIDAFSASEPHIKTSVARLPSPARRLGPVFVDLVADHFLARNFTDVYGEPLAAFTTDAYRTLTARAFLMPSDATRFLQFASENDVFGSYVATSPIERAFTRICRRLNRLDLVAICMDALRSDYAGFERDFRLYYPALRAHADAWLAAERPAEPQC